MGFSSLNLTNGSEKRVQTGSSKDAYARWSESGGAITYESSRDGNPEIYRTDLETGKTTRLTRNTHLDEWPSFSPNGRRIAWASGSEEEKDLWIMQADGSEKKQIGQGMLFGDAFPAWSPSGRQIVLTVREDDVFVLKLIDIETGHVTHLGEGAQLLLALTPRSFTPCKRWVNGHEIENQRNSPVVPRIRNHARLPEHANLDRLYRCRSDQPR